MWKNLLVLCMSMVSLASHAHAPNVAFFDVFESDKELLIKAEFPWTIRNVLLEKMPELKEAKTTEEMEAGLLSYLQQNIQIIDVNNQVFTLEKIQALPNTGHSHGSFYLLVFGAFHPIKSIANTCMFESYDNQKNFHTIDLSDKEKIEFVTENGKPSFSLQNTVSSTNIRWIFILLGIITGLGAFYFLKKR